MTRKQFREYQRKFFDEAHDLMLRKNADYSSGNVEDAPAFANFEIVNGYPAMGVSPRNAAFIRLLDKMSRLSRIMNTESQVKTESIRDTCLDIANYASIICGMIENSKGADGSASLGSAPRGKNVFKAEKNKETK